MRIVVSNVNRLLIFLLLSGSSAFAVDFSREVLPVLQRACFECHGPEVAKAGLRLHEKVSALKGSDHQAVIIPGKPEASELLRRVSLPRQNKEAMPRRGTPLTTAEIATLTQWIQAGAVWPETVQTTQHWAYLPPVKTELPRVTWPQPHGDTNAIDAFVADKLNQQGLHASPQAAASTLLRRVFFDLTGLPPTQEDLARFLPDLTTPHLSDADYERLVDHLLASPEFGVKWARHWLDLARYADSHGFQRDDLRDIWGYRDWVVKALNDGMPFDQFTIEQVAGDLLSHPTPSQIVATGFHRCTPTNVEAGTEPEESRINQVIDRVNTTGAVWLGSTLECAQCHNHKYDPFSQKDYYQLLAYFNNTEKEAERTNPKTPGSIQFGGSPYTLSDPERDQARTKLHQQAEALQAKMDQLQATTKDPTPNPNPKSIIALKPLDIQSSAGAESETQKDQSVLFIGEAPATDVCLVSYELSAGKATGFLLEALTHPSLPGEGPGRGDARRPNFVLQHLEATLVDSEGKSTPLTFKNAYASFSQTRFDVTGLIDQDPATGWAINPQFHQDHWAALALEKPLKITPGSKLQLRLVQEFGGGRTIGRLRFSAFTEAVETNLPATLASEDPKSAQNPALAAMQKQMKAVEKQIDALKPATTEVMRELPKPRMTSIFKRGVYTDPAEPVKAAIPAVFETSIEGPANRLTLAHWLVSRDNPLTARVVVNRLWAEVFGQGIVTTVEDFGIKGAPPSHPELLDWLAVDFMDQGWSLKKALKQIVMSQTYRQSSQMRAGSKEAEMDAANVFLWHGPRFRLDAEAIRDNALTIANLISLEKGGEPIRPPQPDGLWIKVGGQKYNYQVSPGEKQYRRGLYVVLKRGAPYPSFVNFDASARMACVVKRGRSNTPLQALTLLNDPVYVEAAQTFAQRLMKESDVVSRIRLGFRLALAREPAEEELHVMKKLYDSQLPQGEAKATTALASALLNLDETITKG